jgi:acyl dehydratase
MWLLNSSFFVAVVVPLNIGRQFAALCGDYNPIHVHSIFAKLFGFKTAIAHGMWVCGRALSFIEQVPGWTGQNVIELEVFFRKPVPMPSKAKVRLWAI